MVNHFVGINRLRNKKDAYAEILETQGEAAASTYAQATNMSYYDIKDATTYGGSQQTAINQGRAEKGGFLRDAKLIDRMKTSTDPRERSSNQVDIVTSELDRKSKLELDEKKLEPKLPLNPLLSKKVQEEQWKKQDEFKKEAKKEAKVDVAMPKPKKSSKEEESFHDSLVRKSREKSAANKKAMESAVAKDGSSKDVADLKKKYEAEGGTWASGGRARGGLMKKKKNKK